MSRDLLATSPPNESCAPLRFTILPPHGAGARDRVVAKRLKGAPRARDRNNTWTAALAAIDEIAELRLGRPPARPANNTNAVISHEFLRYFWGNNESSLATSYLQLISQLQGVSSE